MKKELQHHCQENNWQVTENCYWRHRNDEEHVKNLTQDGRYCSVHLSCEDSPIVEFSPVVVPLCGTCPWRSLQACISGFYAQNTQYHSNAKMTSWSTSQRRGGRLVVPLNSLRVRADQWECNLDMWTNQEGWGSSVTHFHVVTNTTNEIQASVFSSISVSSLYLLISVTINVQRWKNQTLDVFVTRLKAKCE